MTLMFREIVIVASVPENVIGVCSCTRVKNHLHVKFVTSKLQLKKKHRTCHTGEKQFVCDDCEKLCTSN